ncbi:MAG TPA: DUF3570 domain-containing protein [Polyangiaceae bacterium]|nr:DUF3570 domain-containing protein [Polyangiaceae bacterium]
MRGTGLRTVGAAVLVVAVARAVRAQSTAPPAPLSPPSDTDILETLDERLRVESVTTRITSFDQFGHGYQAQGGPLLGPGSERATILEPQLEVVASQGDRLRHRLWVPVDFVTNASADAIDVVSNASRHVQAGSLDWASTYRLDAASDVTMSSGLHLEEPFRSWNAGMGMTRSFADGDTVLSGNLAEVLDWFDRFDIHGGRHGRTDRSSTTASVGVTQVVTPETVVNVNYGVTLQRGELGNTWNSVPLTDDQRGPEILPVERLRQAVVFRAAQFLPWNGALHLYYRFYADDWGLTAHSIEGELLQRLLPQLYVGALYRFHTQTGVDFFTTLANPNGSLRTADSDLAPLDSQTIGGKVVVDLPPARSVPALHFEFGYERYWRSNDLHTNVVTCATGYRF